MPLKVGLIVMLLVMGTFQKFALKRAKHRALFNPNSEGVPATHLSEGGGHIVPPPGKYSINGPN